MSSTSPSEPKHTRNLPGATYAITAGRNAWIALLDALGFDVQSVPMSQGTPFANVLLVARVREATQANGVSARGLPRGQHA